MQTLKGPVNISIGIGLLSAITLWAFWKYYSKKEKIPEVWRKVGNLTDMMCFPIKSCGVIRLKEMECTELGLRLDWLRDRCFMVVNLSGNFISARNNPKLFLVKPQIVNDHLILEAPDMEPLKIDLKNDSDPQILTKLWGQSMTCLDSGDNAAKWFSRYILAQESGLRLVHSPKDYKKMQKSREKLIMNSDSGAFPDLTSFCLINASSVDDLNTRLKNPIPPQQFRPSFVVTGAEPYEEDYWQWVRIGDVVFKAVRQCTRCVMTTMNTETGERDESQEPLTTLKTYRLIGDPKLKVFDKSSPVMGVHLALRRGGFVKIGDVVQVA